MTSVLVVLDDVYLDCVPGGSLAVVAEALVGQDLLRRSYVRETVEKMHGRRFIFVCGEAQTMEQSMLLFVFFLGGLLWFSIFSRC